MKHITAILLKILTDAYGGREFHVHVGNGDADDRIMLDHHHWLSIDCHTGPTMVTLLNEDRGDGGQVNFWMVLDDTDLNEVVIFSKRFACTEKGTTHEFRSNLSRVSV